MRVHFYKFILGIALLSTVGVFAEPTADSGPVSEDYDRMFTISREVLTRKAARQFLKEIFADQLIIDPEIQAKYGLPDRIKDISEPQLMTLLRYNPEHLDLVEEYIKKVPPDTKLGEPGMDAKLDALRAEWKERFVSLLKKHPEVLSEFSRQNHPEAPFVLTSSDGRPGYSNPRMFSTHARENAKGDTQPPDDLVKEVVAFIDRAKEKLVLNVFDFDLMQVADALIRAGERGVEVRVGIDQGNIEHRAEVKAVFDRLQGKKNVTAVDVDSVGLNHQKLIARDWHLANEGESVLLSGNLTRSGLHPQGDLGHLKPKPKASIPNANHMIVVDGQPLANLIHHELSKALHPDPERRLRGRQFPLSGVYRIDGPEKGKYLLMAFSPQGALGTINEHMIGNMIAQTSGPLHMVQFAFSSDQVEDALFERAKKEIAAGREFDFRSVGERPFALTFWSVFLSMIGWERDRESGEYRLDPESRWTKLLGKEGMRQLRKQILVAPRAYGTHTVKRNGESHQATAKIHHKSLVSGDAAIAGTSFNFSAAADKQVEQLAIFVDREVADYIRSIHDGLKALGAKTLQWTVARRAQWQKETEAKEHYEAAPGNNREALHIVEVAQRTTRKTGKCPLSSLASE